MTDEAQDTAAFTYWEDKYGARDGVWSGRVNAALADVAAELPAGTALDLGAGEGGDALWLAARGWEVTGVDISPTALARAEGAAARAGLVDLVSWVASDLSTWEGSGTFDLVAASFLQSPVSLDRGRILRRGADLVAPGGHLLVVAHAEPPPWSHEHVERSEDTTTRTFPTPQDDLATLDLPEEKWQTVVAEIRDRRAFSPGGEAVVLRDGVLLLRRRP